MTKVVVFLFFTLIPPLNPFQNHDYAAYATETMYGINKKIKKIKIVKIVKKNCKNCPTSDKFEKLVTLAG